MIHNIGKIGRAIIIDSFFDGKTIADLMAGNYTVTAYSDERNSGISPRQKWEIECMPAYAALMDFVRSKAIREYCEEWEDLSWRLVYNDEIKTCEMAISKYERGCGFGWHVDHIMSDRRRVMNWMVTLDGEGFLEWCHEPMPDAEHPSTFVPRDTTLVSLSVNTLVMFPSWYPHQVVGVDDVTRISIHGHFGI